jgi:hypothetical protein
MKTPSELDRPDEDWFRASRVLGRTGLGFALLNFLRAGIPRFSGAPVQVRLGSAIEPLVWLIYDPIHYPQTKGIKSCKYWS